MGCGMIMIKSMMITIFFCYFCNLYLTLQGMMDGGMILIKSKIIAIFVFYLYNLYFAGDDGWWDDGRRGHDGSWW